MPNSISVKAIPECPDIVRDSTQPHHVKNHFRTPTLPWLKLLFIALIVLIGGTDALAQDGQAAVESDPNLFMSALRGLLGMGVILGIAVLFSTDRKAINWRIRNVITFASPPTTI